jgi:hypothetical protein
MSNTQILLDTLSKNLNPDSISLLQDSQWKDTALNYLTDLLNSDHIETLLDTSVMPENTGEIIGISEQIAELSNDSMLIDNKILNSLIKTPSNQKESNISLILNINTLMIDSFTNFDELIYLTRELINSTYFNNWKTEILTINNYLGINNNNNEINNDNNNNNNNNNDNNNNNNNNNINNNNELSLILQNLQNLIEILELPSITHSLIKLGQYSECIEISSLSKRLKIRYNNIELIQNIDENISFEINDMIKKLSNLLATNVKQSSMLKIMSYLKRIINDKKQLKTLFLKLRYKFIMDEFETLLPLKHSKLIEKYLKRILEIFREFCFQTIITFDSLFEKDNQLSHSFLLALVDQLCDILSENLPLLNDESIKDSLLLQLIYCSQSLSRVNGDFTTQLLYRLNDTIPVSRLLTIVSKQKQLVRSLNHV